MILYDFTDEEIRPGAIEIIDIMGRKIKSIQPGTADVRGFVYWDGTNDVGRECGSGVYFTRITGISDAGAMIELENRRKLTLIR